MRTLPVIFPPRDTRLARSKRVDFAQLFVVWLQDLIDVSRLFDTKQPWPVVDEFLRSLPAGSVGLDVGCGNGKYLAVNKDVFIVASDRYVVSVADCR
jgi:hypothetical protein